MKSPQSDVRINAQVFENNSTLPAGLTPLTSYLWRINSTAAAGGLTAIVTLPCQFTLLFSRSPSLKRTGHTVTDFELSSTGVDPNSLQVAFAAPGTTSLAVLPASVKIVRDPVTKIVSALNLDKVDGDWILVGKKAAASAKVGAVSPLALAPRQTCADHFFCGLQAESKSGAAPVLGPRGLVSGVAAAAMGAISLLFA